MICVHQAHEMATLNGDEIHLGCNNWPPSCRDEAYIALPECFDIFSVISSIISSLGLFYPDLRPNSEQMQKE